MTTFYVEGSPSGPEPFRGEAAARAWAQEQADRFRVTTTLHSSATGHTGIRRGIHMHSAGKTLATFHPRPRLVETTRTCVCRCHCHKGTICGLSYDPEKGDCEHDCRGTQSTVVCDPFIEPYVKGDPS